MQTSKIKDVTSYLESLAPSSYQESYDNSGLLTGNPDTTVSGILTTLDVTEDVVEEAAAMNCNLVVAHHPILFKGLKSLTGKSYVERTIITAIKKDIAIYASHTNLDNVSMGVNKRIADKVGLTKTAVLIPRVGTLSKLVTFVPRENLAHVTAALHDAGAGEIGNYKECSFQIEGTGTFVPGPGSNPHIGKAGKPEEVREVRIEMLFPSHLKHTLLKALRKAHPYEEVAYYVTQLENENQEVGAGMIGELVTPEEPKKFLQRLKQSMQATVIRHTALLSKPISKVAVCGGSGSFMLSAAIAQGADAFVSADFKYHDFFDAEGKILIADVGHYESEQFTKGLLLEILSKKFTTFACHFSKTVTNPISYL